jgi:hypothetical protein
MLTCGEDKEVAFVRNNKPNKADRLLFKASTVITIGDGAKARFWHDNWLDGEAPKILPLTCSSWSVERTDQCSKSSTTVDGCTT